MLTKIDVMYFMIAKGMSMNMSKATRNILYLLIPMFLIAIGFVYIVLVKGYWFYGSYTWEHSNIKRCTDADYKKSEEFTKIFKSSDNDSAKQEKLIKLINSGLEVNCPAPSYDVESMETDYVSLPLTTAIIYENYEIAKMLIEKGAVVGRIEGLPSPLDRALSFYDDNDLKTVEFLLKNGAGENVVAEGTHYTNEASRLAPMGGFTLANKEDANRAMLVFMELEDAGADLDQRQVVYAARANNAELLNYLIEEKEMDVNQGLANPPAEYFTPLIGASSTNALETAKYLLKHGADKNLVDSLGRKAIDYASTDEMRALLNGHN
jgi:ankyrin repeat protein